MIRDEVRQFVALGPLPSESPDPVVEEQLQRHQDLLEQISRPVTDEEAKLLLTAFGDDECFGLAWMLLHLIETAPHIPVESHPSTSANQWVQRIWARQQRAKALPGQVDEADGERSL